MCGIAALFKHPDVEIPRSALLAMSRTVAHRGPDGEGALYLDVQGSDPGGALSEAGDRRYTIGLAHRRLSILDLSPAGAQPMTRGALHVVYNGEIYNFIEVRAELARAGHAFTTTSDTEVLLAAYREWGTECFARLKGMWAVVLVDAARGVAVLSRDRLGIKPLYRARVDRGLALCSELKQLFDVPGLRVRPHDDAVLEYLRTGYEDPAATMFEGAEPVAAGCYEVVRLSDLAIVERRSYWQPEHVEQTVHDRASAARSFRSAFERAVTEHMRSDVPVGSALSGGLDSTAVCGVAQRIRERDGADSMHTFTAVFPGDPIDERRWADEVTRSFGTTPHHVAPTAEGFLAEMDAFTWTHDEPSGGFSMYAGYSVARLTRQSGVPVVLNGQGSDEVFCGYWQSYMLHLRRVAKTRPWRLMSELGGALVGGNPELVWQIPVMLRRYRSRRRGSEELLRLRRPRAAVPRTIERVLQMSERERRVFEIRELHLPRLLKWDDRNFMAFSVEGRYPFLDHELIETVLSFDAELLYEHGFTKVPLREGLADVLPDAIRTRRSKVGFETPQDRWLRGPLRPAIEHWLTKDNPAWAYVEPREARRLADRVWQGAGGLEPGQALMRLWFFDRWLRVFFESRPGAHLKAAS